MPKYRVENIISEFRKEILKLTEKQRTGFVNITVYVVDGGISKAKISNERDVKRS